MCKISSFVILFIRTQQQTKQRQSKTGEETISDWLFGDVLIILAIQMNYRNVQNVQNVSSQQQPFIICVTFNWEILHLIGSKASAE